MKYGKSEWMLIVKVVCCLFWSISIKKGNGKMWV